MTNQANNQASGFQTRCLGGCDRSGHVTTPIYLSTNFEFPDTEEAARRANDITAPEFYGRWGSINAREFEALVASLEHTDEAVCASSGLAIISMVLLALLGHKGHFVGSNACYSETLILQRSLCDQLHVPATFINSADIEQVVEALRPNTSIVYVESPANPAVSIVDIASLARLVHERSEALLVVDSTFATPFNQSPIDLGADIVIHSATKYIGGHSDVVAGVAAGRSELMALVREKFSFHGPHLDPFAAWLLCRGIRTLGLRMERHNANALWLAQMLLKEPLVADVKYPYLHTHPQYELATAQMRGGSGMVCFEMAGGMKAALYLLSNLKLIKMAVSLGSTHTLLTHPASMTHNLLSPQELDAAGITEGMMRLSVGLEDPDDIGADLSSAFEKLRGRALLGA